MSPKMCRIEVNKPERREKEREGERGEIERRE
jgi:hypothetical protein